MNYLGAIEYQTGARGDVVKRLQVVLNALGYKVGDADGIYGANTKAGVAKYQSDNGLQPDGIVGPKTWALLIGGTISQTSPASISTPQPTPPMGVSRKIVTPGMGFNWTWVIVGLGGLTLFSLLMSGKKK